MTGSGGMATTIGNYLSNPITAFAGRFCLHFIVPPSGFPRRTRSGCEADAHCPTDMRWGGLLLPEPVQKVRKSENGNLHRLLMRFKLVNCRSRYGTASPAVFRGCGGNFEFHQGRRKAAFSAALAHAPDP